MVGGKSLSLEEGGLGLLPPNPFPSLGFYGHNTECHFLHQDSVILDCIWLERERKGHDMVINQ